MSVYTAQLKTICESFAGLTSPAGYDEIDGFLDFAGTTAYLAAYGYDHNPLQQVRDKEKAAQEYIRAYDPDKLGAHFCDFCGVEIAGGEYDVLKDGRERCSHCSSTALRTGEDSNIVHILFYGVVVFGDGVGIMKRVAEIAGKLL